MSVRDHIGPLKSHRLGIPPEVMRMMRHMSDTKPANPKLLGESLNLYEMLVKAIEQFMAGRCPVEREDHAAQIAAHFIVDAAFVHSCIAATGYQIGDFPYDDLADKILPVTPKPGDHV